MASPDGSLAAAPGTKIKDLIKASREYEPLIPAAVVDYHLKKSGCLMTDPDLVRIVALAAQKLACDVVTETRARAYGRQKSGKRLDEGEKKPKMSTKDLEASLLKLGVVSEAAPYMNGEQ